MALAASLFSAGASGQPLFESQDPIPVVLELPLSDLLRQAKRRPTFSGSLQYMSDDGRTLVLDVEVSPRGNSRLEQCSLPPLSLNLKRQQLESTVFAGQNKLKLVTQCKGSGVYRRYLNQEYLIYRIYNVLTDRSFRVRRLLVTYRDSTGRRPDRTQPAFLIESDEAAARRLGMTTLDTRVVRVSQLDTAELTVFALFQYLIGNTDWSVRKGPGNEGCCHNGKVIAPADSETGWVVLPYDFDQAGLINARYAAPSDLLPIKSVRHRLYRGFCSSNGHLDATIAGFNDKRAAIEQLVSDGPEKGRSALKYLQGFYEIVNDPKKRMKKIVAACQVRKQPQGRHSDSDPSARTANARFAQTGAVLDDGLPIRRWLTPVRVIVRNESRSRCIAARSGRRRGAFD